MNRSWNSYISNILGHFWEKVFSSPNLYSWIKHVIYKLGEPIHNISKLCRRSFTPFKSSRIPACIQPVDIPMSECLINPKTIGSYVFSGTVKQGTISRSIGIPIKYVSEAVYIQDDVLNPTHVWIPGINMRTYESMVVLDVPIDYNIPRNVITKDGDLCPVYHLYVRSRNSRTSAIMYENTGFICDIDLSCASRQEAERVWEVCTHGYTVSAINSLMASAVYSTTCERNSEVSDIWRECGYGVVLGADGSVYYGKGMPTVTIRDTIQVGDILFTGVSIFDRFHIPTSAVVPFLTIKSVYGPITARNEVMPPINVNGVYLPDMGNRDWAYHVGSSLNGNNIILADGSDINPMEYTLKYLFPGRSTIYAINSNNIKESALTAVYTLMERQLGSGVFSVYNTAGLDTRTDNRINVSCGSYVAVACHGEPTYYNNISCYASVSYI